MPDSPPPNSSRLKVVSLHDRGGLLERLEAEPALIQPRFHTVADLRRGMPVGYEAVLSVGGDEALPPHEWSARVHRSVAGRVEAHLVRATLAARERLPDGAYLAVDVSAAALLSQELPEVLAAAGRLERFVLIVTDESQQAPTHEVRRALDAVREAGAQVGVDETGSGLSLIHI